MKKKYKKRIRIVFLMLLLCSILAACDTETRVDPKYNLTGMGNASGILPLFQLVNSELMHGLFGTEILLAVFAITFMAFIVATGGDGIRSFAASSYIAFVLNLFLLGLDLVPPWTIFATIILTAIATVMIKT